MEQEQVNVDGRYDPNNPNIRYLGSATKQPNGKWICLAEVYGALCKVEVVITLDPQPKVAEPAVPAGSACPSR